MKFCMLILLFGLSLLSWLHESHAENIDCDENGKCRQLSSEDQEIVNLDSHFELKSDFDLDTPQGDIDLDTTDVDKKHESDPLPKIGRINLSATKTKGGKKDKKKRGKKDKKKGGKKDKKKRGTSDKKRKGKNSEKAKNGKPNKGTNGEKPVKATNTSNVNGPPEEGPIEDIPGGVIKMPGFIYMGEDSLYLKGNDSLSFGREEDSLLPDEGQPEKPVKGKPTTGKPGKNKGRKGKKDKSPKKKGNKPPKKKRKNTPKKGSKGRSKDTGNTQFDDQVPIAREMSPKDQPDQEMVNLDSHFEPEGDSDLDTHEGEIDLESDPLSNIGGINLSSTKTKAGKKDRKKKGGKDGKKKGRKDRKKKGRKDPKKKGGNKDKKGKGGKNPEKAKNGTNGEKPEEGLEEGPQEDIPGGVIKIPGFIYMGEDSELLDGKDSFSFGGEEDSLLPDKEQPEKPVKGKQTTAKPGKNKRKKGKKGKSPKKKGNKPTQKKPGKGSKRNNKDTGNTRFDVLNAGFTEEQQSGLPGRVNGKASFLYIGAAFGILCVVAGIIVAIVIKKRKKSVEKDEEGLEEEATKD